MAKLAKRVDVTARTVEFVLSNGSKLLAEYDKLSPAMKVQVGLHGISQKVGDTAASLHGQPVAALGAMQTAWESLLNDSWSVRQSGSTDFTIAYAEVMGMSEEEAAEDIKTFSEEQSKEVLKSKAIQAILLRLKSERADAAAKASVDPAAELRKILGK